MEKTRARLALFAMLSLASCASLDANEGAVDYRLARIQADKGYALYDQKLFARPDGDHAIRAGDLIRVNLKSVFVAEFPESKLAAFFQGEFNPKTFEVDAHGEIVVVANVTSQAAPISSRNSRESVPGHVVFFSRDFRERQTGNDVFMPVAGPMKWDGGDLTVEINMLEIDDVERTRADSMLRTLTRLSTESNLLNPATAGILNSLGSAVVQATNRDSIILHHRVTFVADTALTGRVTAPTLREGDIVFIRKEQRDAPVDWSRLRYLPSAGILVTCSAARTLGANRELTNEALAREAGCQSGERTWIWREDSYLVITVSRASLDRSAVTEVSLAAFTEALNKEAQATADTSAASIQQAANFAVRRQNYVQLKRDEEALRSVSSSEAGRRLAAQRLVTALQCNVMWRVDRLSAATWDGIDAAILGYCGGKAFKDTGLLEEAELNNLLSALSANVKKELEGKVADPQVFTAAGADSAAKRVKGMTELRAEIMSKLNDRTTAATQTPPPG